MVETTFDNPGKYEEKYVAVDGYRTHYYEAGKGEPLVLVHGGNFYGALRWYPTIIPLSKQFHVYAVDELGQGYTDAPRKPEDLNDTTVRAEHVIDFIETLRLGKVNLVGQSTGGWIVTYITLKRPDLVKKLVLADSGSTSGAETKGTLPRNEQGLTYIDRAFEKGTQIPVHDLSTKEGVRSHMLIMDFYKSEPDPRFFDKLEPIAKKWAPIHLANNHANVDKSREETGKRFWVDGKHISESVHKISVPTLVLWAKYSSKGVDEGVELYKKIPDAEMHILDKCSHFLWIEQADKFNSVVSWFLSKEN